MANEFSYFDIQNREYPEGVFPKKNDFVTNYQTGDEYVITYVDDFGRVTLKELGNPLNDQTDEYRSVNHFPELTHKPDVYIDYTKTFYNTVEGVVLTKGRKVYFSKYVVTGPNTDHYRLFEDPTQAAVSSDPTVTGSNLRDYVPAVTVTRGDGTYKAPGDMLVNKEILPGCKVTLVAYDNENNPISIIPLNVGRTFCRTRDTDGVIGIEIVSPYNSSSDLSLIDIRDREGEPSLSDFSLKIHMDDGSFQIFPLDDNTYSVSGLRDFLVDQYTSKTRVTAVYKASAQAGSCIHVKRHYTIIKNEPIPVEQPPVEEPQLPEATGWTTLGYYSRWNPDTSQTDDFTEVQFEQHWDNDRFSQEIFPQSGSNFYLVPYGGWERGIKPAVIRVKCDASMYTSTLRKPLKLMLFNKGLTLIPTWTHLVTPDQDPSLSEHEYYIYLIVSRWPKSKYPNDIRDELGGMKTYDGLYSDFRAAIRAIDVVSLWPEELEDYKLLGRMRSTVLRDSTFEYNDLDGIQNNYKYNLPDQYVHIGDDRLYTSPRTGKDVPASTPNEQWPNNGIEIDLAGPTYVGYILHGSLGVYQDLIDQHGVTYPLYSGRLTPREVFRENPNSNLHDKNLVITARIGRVTKEGMESEPSDGNNPDWYIGIDDWLKFSIDDFGNVIFADSRSGVTVTHAGGPSKNTGDIYLGGGVGIGPVEGDYRFINFYDRTGYFGDGFLYDIRMINVTFAYNKESGKAVLYIDDTKVQEWSNYPANFSESPSRMVYNRGTFDKTATAGDIDIIESDYLSDHLIETGMGYTDIFNKTKETILSYGNYPYINSIWDAEFGGYKYGKKIENPDLTNSIPFFKYHELFDFWAAELVMEKLGIAPNEPSDVPDRFLNNHLNLFFVGSSTFDRVYYTFDTPGYYSATVRWHQGVSAGTPGDVFPWADLSLFTLEQITEAQNFMEEFTTIYYPDDPYPDFMLVDFGEL